MNTKVLIIIPAYNEEKSIAGVIESLSKFNPQWDILIINDGSRDKTSEIAKSSKIAKVIDLPINLGIGGAVQTGFKYARNNNYDIAVQFDGDGQHLAEEIPKIIDPVLKSEADAVIGSRFSEKTGGWKSTFSRRIGIRILSFLNSILIRQRITDSTSGFRAYNKETIKFLAEHYPHDFPEPETVILLGKNNFVIKETYCEMKERTGGVSSIRGLKSVYYMIKVIFSILIVATRKPFIRDNV